MIVVASKEENFTGCNEKKPLYKDYKEALVELQGIEPWSKHIRHKLSTCLFMH